MVKGVTITQPRLAYDASRLPSGMTCDDRQIKGTSCRNGQSFGGGTTWNTKFQQCDRLNIQGHDSTIGGSHSNRIIFALARRRWEWKASYIADRDPASR